MFTMFNNIVYCCLGIENIVYMGKVNVTLCVTVNTNKF